MRKITKDSFLSLKGLAVITPDELRSILGGANDCVLQCLGYLDPKYSAGDYESFLKTNYAYDASSGIRTDDICGLGNCGSLTVREANMSIGITIPSNGVMDDGSRLIMLIPGANNMNHAVIVTGRLSENGVGKVVYFDPSTGQSGKIDVTSVSGLYLVSGWGSKGSTSGSSSSGGSGTGGSSTTTAPDNDEFNAWQNSCGNTCGNSCGNYYDYTPSSSSSGGGNYYA